MTQAERALWSLLPPAPDGQEDDFSPALNLAKRIGFEDGSALLRNEQGRWEAWNP